MTYIYILISLSIPVIVGLIRHHKEHKSLPKFKWAIMNWNEALFIFGKSFMFFPCPRAFLDSSDGKYAEIVYEKLLAAVAHAHEIMIRDGWTRKNYVWRKLDCEDYAMKLKVEMVKYLASTIDEGAGMPVGLFGYTRKDGSRHVLVKAIAGNDVYYFDIFPEPQYAVPKELTPEEVKSCDLHLF